MPKLNFSRFHASYVSCYLSDAHMKSMADGEDSRMRDGGGEDEEDEEMDETVCNGPFNAGKHGQKLTSRLGIQNGQRRRALCHRCQPEHAQGKPSNRYEEARSRLRDHRRSQMCISTYATAHHIQPERYDGHTAIRDTKIEVQGRERRAVLITVSSLLSAIRPGRTIGRRYQADPVTGRR